MLTLSLSFLSLTLHCRYLRIVFHLLKMMLRCGHGQLFHLSSLYFILPMVEPLKRVMFGASLPSFSTKLYLASCWNTKIGTSTVVDHIRCMTSDRYPKHSLLRFLVVSNSLDLILDFILESWSAVIGMWLVIYMSYAPNRCTGFVPPYALQEILAALAANTPESQRTAFKWAIVAFVANLSFAQVDLFQGWHTRRCYERTRGQLFCSLHYKALKRRDISDKYKEGGEEKESADLGKIVNLMQYVLVGTRERHWPKSIEAMRMPLHNASGTCPASSLPQFV